MEGVLTIFEDYDSNAQEIINEFGIGSFKMNRPRNQYIEKRKHRPGPKEKIRALRDKMNCVTETIGQFTLKYRCPKYAVV